MFGVSVGEERQDRGKNKKYFSNRFRIKIANHKRDKISREEPCVTTITVLTITSKINRS